VVLRGGVIESPSEKAPQTPSERKPSLLPRRHGNAWRYAPWTDHLLYPISSRESSSNVLSSSSSDTSISFMREITRESRLHGSTTREFLHEAEERENVLNA
jgi:hypothetical protein